MADKVKSPASLTPVQDDLMVAHAKFYLSLSAFFTSLSAFADKFTTILQDVMDEKRLERYQSRTP